MKKKIIAALLITVFMTGCRTEASVIMGDKASEEIAADVVDILGADASSTSNDEIIEDSVPEEEIDEEKYGSYEQFIENVRHCVQKGELKGLDVSSNVDNMYRGESEEIRYGYIIRDLDGDGIKELILGGNACIKDTDISGKDRYHTLIFDIFTMQDSVMLHVVKSEEGEDYYFGTDGTIIREDIKKTTMPSDKVMEVATFFRFNKDRLDIVEGIRDEYIAETDRVRYFYSKDNPYWDSSNEITYDKWMDIVKEHGNEYVRFTDFVEPKRTGRKTDVFVCKRDEDYIDPRMQYTWRDYIVFYNDNTGIYNVGNGGESWFVWNTERIQYDNDPLQAKNYVIEGDTLKIGDEEYIREK